MFKKDTLSYGELFHWKYHRGKDDDAYLRNALEVSPSTSFGTGPLARISTGARKLAAASISTNTRAAYQGQLQRLYDYLDGQPLTDDTLAEYLTSLHDVGKSPAAAGQLVAAVRFQSKTTSQPSPVGPVSQAVLGGLRRKGKGRGRGQVKGIQWQDADVMAALAANGNHSLAGLRDAAIIATMTDGMLRVSELCALVVEDVTFETGRLRASHHPILRRPTRKVREPCNISGPAP